VQGSGACWPIHCPRRRLAITARQRADVDCAIPKFKARSTSCPSINAAPENAGSNAAGPELFSTRNGRVPGLGDGDERQPRIRIRYIMELFYYASYHTLAFEIYV